MAKGGESTKTSKKTATARATAKKGAEKSAKKAAAKPKPVAAKKAGPEKRTKPAPAKATQRAEKAAPVATEKERRAARPVEPVRPERPPEPPTEKAQAVSAEPLQPQRPARPLEPEPAGAPPLEDKGAAATAPVATGTDVAGPAAKEEPAEPPPLPTEPEIVSELDGVRLPATRGKVGVFGGPKDHSAKPDDKLALPTGRYSQYERIRSLDARGYYCAMRWDYRQNRMSPEEGKRWWANKKIVITNPTNGKSVVVRAVDYGPHENTGLAVSISPGAADAIAVNVGDQVEMVFADQKSPLGPVRQE